MFGDDLLSSVFDGDSLRCVLVVVYELVWAILVGVNVAIWWWNVKCE